MPPRLTKYVLLAALIILGIAVYQDRNWLWFWRAFGAPQWSLPIHAPRPSATLPPKPPKSLAPSASAGSSPLIPQGQVSLFALKVASESSAESLTPPAAGSTESPRPIKTQVLDPELPHFAFAVADGKKLLMEGAQPTNPDVLTRGLLPSGDASPLRFDGFQRGDEHSNGRDAAYNLASLTGTLYSIQGPALDDDQSYLLVSDVFLAEHRTLKIERANGTIPPETATRLAELKGRKVQKSWALANLGDQGTVYWVIFDPVKGQRALACMVLRSAGSLATMDVPGPEDGEQSWRVGEDADTAGEGFTILYACRTEAGLEWAYEWAAEEGEDLRYVIQRGDRIEEMKGASAYRYLEPI